MLTALSIRDVVLIERLDVSFGSGLTVLTGETGAGKSILLDAFALALGGRGDAALVRQGAEQGQVTAVFDVSHDHPARVVLANNDIAVEESLLLRRVQFADGRTRAFVNDQPVSVQVLKALGASLVEIHGQHDDRALVDIAVHRTLLDAYQGLDREVAAVASAFTAWRANARARSDPKVLRQLEPLRLVVRADSRAVELVRPRQHFFVDQPADDLAVLEDERHFARAHFQHCARS